jgi:uncharacterized repeat protein (TIGR03833 family)
MEKDFFPDRSEEAKYNSKISEGDIVMICEKHMQKTAQTKDDLTEGIVWEKLTSADFHPRGIKLRLMSGEVGRIVYLIQKIDN